MKGSEALRYTVAYKLTPSGVLGNRSANILDTRRAIVREVQSPNSTDVILVDTVDGQVEVVKGKIEPFLKMLNEEFSEGGVPLWTETPVTSVTSGWHFTRPKVDSSL